MMTIDHIDAIARKKRRDVLYVTFSDSTGKKSSGQDQRKAFDWKESPQRNGLIAWLKRQSIGWLPCAGVANLVSKQAYRGGLYVDLPVDEQSPKFRAFLDYVEFLDGTPRTPTLRAYICSLADAQNNSAHDAPGFWEQWARTF
jgi:hypothetical protein